MIFFIWKGEELSKVEQIIVLSSVHPNPTKSVEREVGMVDKNVLYNKMSKVERIKYFAKGT